MPDIPEGVVTGDAKCVNHDGFDHLRWEECCGGQEKVFAVIRCKVLGMVAVGKKPCDYICKFYSKKT